MLEVRDNIWDVEPHDKNGFRNWIAITTNGFVTKTGKLVMGRGVALEAKQRIADIDVNLGYLVRYANIPYALPSIGKDGKQYNIVSLPVKPVWGEVGEPGWQAKADVEFIVFSLQFLANNVVGYNDTVYFPRPGCGNGGLDWYTEVKPAIIDVIPKHWVCIDRNNEESNGN